MKITIEGKVGEGKTVLVAGIGRLLKVLGYDVEVKDSYSKYYIDSARNTPGFLKQLKQHAKTNNRKVVIEEVKSHSENTGPVPEKKASKSATARLDHIEMIALRAQSAYDAFMQAGQPTEGQTRHEFFEATNAYFDVTKPVTIINQVRLLRCLEKENNWLKQREQEMLQLLKPANERNQVLVCLFRIKEAAEALIAPGPMNPVRYTKLRERLQSALHAYAKDTGLQGDNTFCTHDGPEPCCGEGQL